MRSISILKENHTADGTSHQKIISNMLQVPVNTIILTKLLKFLLKIAYQNWKKNNNLNNLKFHKEIETIT